MQALGIDLPTGAPLSIGALLVNLTLGFGLALVLRWHFERFGTTLSNRAEFAQVFPFIVLTTVLIISVVKSSLALSLGLVGALSIVRFRTPVKEPEELAYLFVAIAMGLGLGADQALPTVVAALSILGAVAALRWSRGGRERRNLYLSVEWSEPEREAPAIAAIEEVVARNVATGDLRRFDKRDGAIGATYLVDVSSTAEISKLIEDLEASFPGIHVTFIDQGQIPSI
jgi:uncharacterized membrane protein YhiD involved in acid resistance